MTCDALPAATRIGRPALRVTDLDGVVDFYRLVVGLELQTRTDATATLGAGGTPLLELERDPDAEPRGNRAGLFHTVFRIPSRAALGGGARTNPGEVAARRRVRPHRERGAVSL